MVAPGVEPGMASISSWSTGPQRPSYRVGPKGQLFCDCHFLSRVTSCSTLSNPPCTSGFLAPHCSLERRAGFIVAFTAWHAVNAH